MTDRVSLVRRGLWLNYTTIGYNVVEAIVALIAGAASGSIALFGFGIDSVIEVTASGAAQWRLRADADHVRRDHSERVSVRFIGWSFMTLAAYVTYEPR
jgi:divalent metal cation (Fe/Co/Zn/Cd) transporter